MSWTNEDVRDEIYEQDEEEDEGPSWVDDKGKILEAAFCEYFLTKHPLMCLKQTLFDLDGEVDEDKLIYEIHQEIRYHARNDVAKKVKRLVEALKIEAYREEWKPQLDRIHLKNGTYYLDERGFVSDKELCLNRLPVEYQADAAPPVQWLKFLDELLISEDILTLQEYIGYLLIPSTKAQKMLILTGKGGEGKSRIGLLLKKLLGPAAHMEAVLRLETNRFASANLEHKLMMIDDDLNMTALPETRNIKSIVTAEDRICVERKGKQATQGLLYARLLCFYETRQRVFRPLHLYRPSRQTLPGLGELQDQKGSPGAQDHGGKGTSGWHLSDSRFHHRGRTAGKMGSDPIQQAQMGA